MKFIFLYIFWLFFRLYILYLFFLESWKFLITFIISLFRAIYKERIHWKIVVHSLFLLQRWCACFKATIPEGEIPFLWNFFWYLKTFACRFFFFFHFLNTTHQTVEIYWPGRLTFLQVSLASLSDIDMPTKYVPDISSRPSVTASGWPNIYRYDSTCWMPIEPAGSTASSAEGY